MYSFYKSEKKNFLRRMKNKKYITNIKLIYDFGKLIGMLELLYQYDKITTDLFLSENTEIRTKVETYSLKLNSNRKD